jgi:hypothetical protein
MRNGMCGVVGALVLFSSGCGTVLYDRPVTKQGDSWTITVRKLQDGPNSFPMGAGVSFYPADGSRLLYLSVTVRNDAAAKRKFSYDACDLDAGADAILPGLIDRDMTVHMLADKEETYDPGEERERRLLYSYPGGGYPTRVRCGLSTFALR